MNSKDEKGVWKHKIEDFIERKNGIIQICFFVFLLICSGIFLLGKESNIAITIQLLTLISVELLNLNIKDSISHRKLNKMSKILEMDTGALIRVSDFDLLPFFEHTQDHLFISGIALSFFFQNFQKEILQLLKKGKKLYIIIISHNLIDDCTDLYYGISSSDKLHKQNQCDIINKQLLSLDSINNEQKLFEYFDNGQIQLRIAKNIFSTSFVAYDVFDNSILEQIKRNEYKEIRASFYQYACTDSKNEPSITVDSKDNEDWYDFFVETIRKQWKDSEIITTKTQLENVINELKIMVR